MKVILDAVLLEIVELAIFEVGWVLLPWLDCWFEEKVKVSTLDLVSLDKESSRSNCGKSTEVKCADSLWYMDKSLSFFDLWIENRYESTEFHVVILYSKQIVNKYFIHKHSILTSSHFHIWFAAEGISNFSTDPVCC